MLENRWAMLAVIFLTRTAMGLMYQSLAAVGPFLIDDLRLTYFHYSLLLGLFLLPGGVMALPGGMLGQRFGSRHIASAGLASDGRWAASSPRRAQALRSPQWVASSSGVGGVLLNVALTKMVADWFTGREISTAMGVMLTSFPVGMALAMALSASARRRIHMARRHPRHAWSRPLWACICSLFLYRNPPVRAEPKRSPPASESG